MLSRRNLLRTAPVIPAAASGLRAQVQASGDALSRAPAGVRDFVARMRDQASGGRQVLATLWQGADTAGTADALDYLLPVARPMSEMTPPRVIVQSVRMPIESVAVLDLRIERLATVGGRLSVDLWIALERHGTNWVPVLVRLTRTNGVPERIPGFPSTRFA